jgi:SWI/SNF-related matrix-associated actin-dependent regulator of chromatin subfamily A containing DEAD/H box 1
MRVVILNVRFSLQRILLTGTPVQNNPKELMSLLCFLMPFFKKPKGGGWDDEKEVGNDGGARMLSYFVELSKGGEDAKKDAYEKLKNLMAPFVLRRKKVRNRRSP